MHAAAYHLQDSLNKFENVKQFSGQGNTLVLQLFIDSNY